MDLKSLLRSRLFVETNVNVPKEPTWFLRVKEMQVFSTQIFSTRLKNSELCVGDKLFCSS